MDIDLAEALQKHPPCVERPEQRVDHDDREAGDEIVECIRGIKRQRRPHRPVQHDKDADGGHHGTHRRRERKPVGEQQAGKYPEERQYHIEKRRWMKCHEQNGRDAGADDDGRLHQQPIEPRTGHAEAHEQKDKYRRELTT